MRHADDDSDKASVDSATSATQVKLSKCYRLLHDLNRAMDYYDSRGKLPKHRDLGANGRLIREEMAAIVELVKARVDNIIKERRQDD